MQEAIVNDERTYRIEQTAGGTAINGTHYPVDIYRNGTRHFHSIHRRASYSIELQEADYERKQFTFRLRGQTVTVALKDELDLMVEKLGMAQSVETAITEIAAPMPGLIVGLAVEAGQEIRRGDSVLTLEAMKMENVIKSPVDGTVSVVHVKAGDSVDKNQRLVSFI